MKQYFAYIRVSTMKQGEHGVSLQEQKSEIERYAQQRNMRICEWLEERETAAKRGRVIFDSLMKRLRRGEASGVIIHKIDRSARNLRDWVDIGQLTDDGIEVHFTREAVDLQSSSGRLAADVQAVVAANYVRNLREEVIKGFYGRLKQGISPLPAPLGYLDAGRGKAKVVDPERGPLVRRAFELYATGRFSHFSLREEMVRLGLKTKRGEPVSKNTLAWILNNPFYYGLIRINKNKKTFAGIHVPIVSKATFDRVQDVAAGRLPRASPTGRHQFLFSRLIACKACSRCLIAERQKGRVYYRCHTRSCKCSSIREDDLEAAIIERLAGIRLNEDDLSELERYANQKRTMGADVQHNQLVDLEFRFATIEQRLNRLTDAFLDGHIDVQMLTQRKETLLSERLDVEGRISELKRDFSRALVRMEEFVELVKSANSLYEKGTVSEKRRIVEKALSNRQLDGKRLILSLRTELFWVADRYGDPAAFKRRTFWKKWIDSLANTQTGPD
jgi:site-specific DNA recombinase